MCSKQAPAAHPLLRQWRSKPAGVPRRRQARRDPRPARAWHRHWPEGRHQAHRREHGLKPGPDAEPRPAVAPRFVSHASMLPAHGYKPSSADRLRARKGMNKQVASEISPAQLGPPAVTGPGAAVRLRGWAPSASRACRLQLLWSHPCSSAAPSRRIVTRAP